MLFINQLRLFYFPKYFQQYRGDLSETKYGKMAGNGKHSTLWYRFEAWEYIFTDAGAARGNITLELVFAVLQILNLWL